jgi:pilus assembly protein Flp/PilA
MKMLFKTLGQDERGATAVEYGLICSLIVIAMVAGLNNFADSTINMWNHVANNVIENT